MKKVREFVGCAGLRSPGPSRGTAALLGWMGVLLTAVAIQAQPAVPEPPPQPSPSPSPDVWMATIDRAARNSPQRVEAVAAAEQALVEWLERPDRPEDEAAYRNWLPLAEAIDRDYRAGFSVEVPSWKPLEARQRLDEVRRCANAEPDLRRQLSEASRLNARLGDLVQAGQLDEALEIAGRVVEIRRRCLGEDSYPVVEGVGNQAFCLEALGRWDEALAAQETAIAAHARLFPLGHPNHIEFLRRAAGLLRQTGRPEDALARLEAARTMAVRLFPQGHEIVVPCLTDLAHCLEDVGRRSAALSPYQEAAALAERLYGTNSLVVAMCWNNWGVCLDSLGRHTEALPLYQAALAVYERESVGDPEDWAGCLSNLATCLDSQGNSPAALPHHREALAMRRRLAPEGNQDVALSLNNLGRCLLELGDAQQALVSYQEALEILRKQEVGVSLELATLLNSLGKCWDELDRPEAALTNYVHALSMLRTVYTNDHPVVVLGLNNVGYCQGRLGRTNEALALYQEALGMADRLFVTDHPDRAITLNNLAACLDDSGQVADALPKYQQATAMWERLWGRDHPDVARGLGNVGTCLLRLQRPTEASRYFVDSTITQWRYLTRHFPSLTERQKKRFLARGALRQNEKLWDMAFRGAAGLAPDAFRGALLSKQLLTEAARAESGALLGAIEQASPEWKLKWQSRDRLRREYATLALQGWSAGDTPGATAAKSALDLSQVSSLALRVEALEEELRRENAEYARASRLEAIDLESVVGTLRAGEVVIEYVRYRPYEPGTRDWGGERYGAFVVASGGKVTAVDLGEASIIDHAVAGFRREVLEAIDKYRVMRPGRRMVRESEAAIAEHGSILRARVWEPLGPLVASARRVYVAPDGALGLIPFEALSKPDENGQAHYLVQTLEIVYLNTSRDLARLSAGLDTRDGETNRLTAVLVGNPDFSLRPEDLAAVLSGAGNAASPANPAPQGNAAPQASPASAGGPGSSGSTLGSGSASLDDGHGECGREWDQKSVLADLVLGTQEQLGKLGWSVETLLGDQATEDAVLRLGRPEILQFATHGCFLRPFGGTEEWENPLLRSMLILAGANRRQATRQVFYHIDPRWVSEPEARGRGLTEADLASLQRVEVGDGLLTAYEVSGINLRGTALVNLTACETGLGEVTSDGIAGLRQAFLLAGARAVTMSMWEVPAMETTQQLGDFYRRWLGSGSDDAVTGRYAAFRAAQLAALASARQEYGSPHPFYWAGTIYVGDPGDLPR